MNKTKYIALSLTGILLCAGLSKADSEKLYFIAPTQLPNVSREMKTAGFWISRTPKVDKLIMNPQTIEIFNHHLRHKLKLTKDLMEIPDPFRGSELSEELLSQINDLRDENYFGEDGEPAPETFYEEMASAVALEEIEDEIEVQYGFIVRFSDQRFLPTEEGLYASALDIDFDELQNSDLDIATPVIVLHHSADKKWLYVLSEISDGWVWAENVALCPRDEFEDHMATQQFIVITDGKADIYLNQELTKYYDHLRMGSKLPLENSTSLTYAVKIPTRKRSGELEMKTAFIKKTQASQGYLEFTPRNILEQAFKLLNEPYGWGGMYGEQDCSRFLAEVFSTVGIHLPRDSKNQAQAGRRIAEFSEGASIQEKISALKNVSAGGTILPMKGHIMLYLGMVEERPYAIQAVWGYREGSEEGDVIRVIDRVAVSDLYLGEGSKKGSLLQRLNAIVSLRRP